MLDDEVKAILRELLAATGGATATIAPANGEQPGDQTRVAPLGGGNELRLDLGPDSGAPADGGSTDLGAAVEHAVRALRAAARRWDAALPAVTIGTPPTSGHERAKQRIVAFLGALASVQNARNACVVVDHRMVAWAHSPEPLDEARWPLLERRAHAAASPGASSHGELTDPDAYAVTFWYGAALLVYFAGPYGVDFIRHRAKLVTRELALLLPLLDPGPTTPAQRLPVP
jgi:hypothetical protein